MYEPYDNNALLATDGRRDPFVKSIHRMIDRT